MILNNNFVKFTFLKINVSIPNMNDNFTKKINNLFKNKDFISGFATGGAFILIAFFLIKISLSPEILSQIQNRNQNLAVPASLSAEKGTASLGLNINNYSTKNLPLSKGEKIEKIYHLPVVQETPIKNENVQFGYPNLSHNLIAVGKLDPISNNFIATTDLQANDRIAIKFEILNIGTNQSGPWNFSASLPTFPWSTFQSEIQENLKPGEKIEFILGFDKIEKPDGNRVLITIDPTNKVWESDETDNVLEIFINNVRF